MASETYRLAATVRENGVATLAETLREVAELYGVDAWGAGYFDIDRSGRLIVRPAPYDAWRVSVVEVVEELAARGVSLPVLLRFPQIIHSQVHLLQAAFAEAIGEFGYKGEHVAVYPMKVNQRRRVVCAYLEAAAGYGWGLEAGSKAELYAALTLPQTPRSLLVLNGFKDQDFMRLAFLAARLGKNVVVVIEKLSELAHYCRCRARADAAAPMLGMRVKLHARGSGRWEHSGGEGAKFGLTTTEVLEVVRRCREAGLLDNLRLLHFHIGSQLTDIKRIKAAVKEAARVYAKLYKMGVPIRYIDVGGGLAVDYDGSRTSFASSANYSMQEYANAIVYHTQLVCDDEGVPHPDIVTESGRVLTAHHALLVTNIQDEIETVVEEVTPLALTKEDPQVIEELADLNRHISLKNYVEYFHDAIELREELFTLFDLGLITLEQRAKGEVFFWDVCEKAELLARRRKHVPEEFLRLRKLLAARYLANFSVFSSVPDSWAIDHLFPVMPIHRLLERPSEYATFCDLTCDSDGVIDRFVDLHDVKEILEVHPLRKGEPYYIAVLLVGAYQEVMGSRHNLLGRVNEAEVWIEEDGFRISHLRGGETVRDVLQEAGYDPDQLRKRLLATVAEQRAMGKLQDGQAKRIVDEYDELGQAYTYLNPDDALGD